MSDGSWKTLWKDINELGHRTVHEALKDLTSLNASLAKLVIYSGEEDEADEKDEQKALGMMAVVRGDDTARIEKLLDDLNDIPSKKDIQKFYYMVQKLSLFEAEQRTNRGYGIFTEDQVPDKTFMDVMEWLEQLSK